MKLNKLTTQQLEAFVFFHQCHFWKLRDDGKYRCWCGCPAPEEG